MKALLSIKDIHKSFANNHVLKGINLDLYPGEIMGLIGRSGCGKSTLIKILVGANYLGETQIKYIKSMVLKSMVDYTEDQLPSVIIFDNFNAAAAMSLNEAGYQIDRIVFADEKHISEETKTSRTNQISLIINQINAVNKEVFQEKLKSYYN